MVNRYEFEGNGTQVLDSLGGTPGTVYFTTLDGTGKVNFPSGVAAYVELPGGLISSLPNASFEVWFVWRGGLPWQRLFDFGDVGFLMDPVNYLYLTPYSGGSDLDLAGGLRHLTGNERQIHSGVVPDTGVLTQVVLVADDVANRLTLYKDGQWLVDVDTDVRLDGIQDGRNRLGRSPFPEDPPFNGEIFEFRIYGEVLSPAMVQKSFELGPDATYPPTN